MNRDYVRIAHRRAAMMELQRVLMDTYIPGDSPAKKEVICDEVPFSDKEVTAEALIEVYELLERLQQEEKFEMSKFEFRRRDDRTASEQPPKPPKARKDEERRPVKPGKKRREAGPRAPGADGSTTDKAG
jgi:hypothetical protein